MNFLVPAFLAGMGLLAVPLWLHLRQQHQKTPLEFPSVRLFERRTVTATKKNRLRYLALLAMRLLMLLLLALAFAQPFWQRKVAVARGKRTVVLAVDNSFSMRRGDILEAAKRKAMELAGGIVPGQRGVVITFGSQVRELGPVTPDPSTVRAQAAGITASDEEGRYAELFRSLRTLQESQQAPLEVHLISDMQKSGLNGQFAELQVPPGSTMTVHDVGQAAASNYFVEQVRTPGRIFDTATARMEVTVANRGGEGPAKKSVVVEAGGRTLHSKEVTVPANGRQTVEFIGFDVGYGLGRGVVRMEGADGFSADDRMRFAIERSDPRKVLFLHSNREAKSPTYFRTALESIPGNGFRLDAAAVETSSAPNLDQVSFVVLSDTGRLPAATEQAVRRFVEKGGSALVAVGPFTAAAGSVPVSGLPVAGSRLSGSSGDVFQTIAKREELHPVMKASSGWDSARFYQVAEIEAGENRVLARTGTGQPLLVEQRLGEGLLLLFASSFDNVGNNFPVHPGFPPFVDQAANFLGRNEDAAKQVVVGDTVQLRASQEKSGSIEVLNEQGQRLLSLAETVSASTFRPDAEGFFEVRRGNGRNSLLAANAGRRESDLEKLNQEDWAVFQGTAGAAAAQAGSSSQSEQNEQIPFWPYLLALLAVVTIAEAFFSGRYLTTAEEQRSTNLKEAV